MGTPFREGQGDWPREDGDESSHVRLRGIKRSKYFSEAVVPIKLVWICVGAERIFLDEERREGVYHRVHEIYLE